MLEITRVEIRTLRSPRNPRIRAFARIEVAGMLVINNLKVYTSPSGRLLVCMPNTPERRRCPGCDKLIPKTDQHCRGCGRHQARPKERVTYRDSVFPTCREQRAVIESAVLHAYDSQTSKESQWVA
jgi:DNA-binding cell septation regulator SpoVG